MWAQAINTLLGIWLMAAPALLAYGGVAADHDHIVGPVVATFACVAIWEATRAVRWANLPIGLWMLAAPWVLNFPAPATTNALLSGLLIAALSIPRGRFTHRFGGGWSSLWRATPRPQR